MEQQEPQVSKVDELADRLSEELSRAVSRFVLSSNTAQEPWDRMMNRVLKGELTEYLIGDFNDYLTGRGLNPLPRERVIVLVRAALANTGDIRTTLLTAPDPDGIVAGGRFSLGTIIDRTHQLGIVKSIIRFLQGQAENISGEGGDGYTGRKRWRTSVSSSRHSFLNFVEASPDGTWNVAPGTRWEYPRQDPTMAASASGCRCFIEYLYINPITNEEEWL